MDVPRCWDLCVGLGLCFHCTFHMVSLLADRTEGQLDAHGLGSEERPVLLAPQRLALLHPGPAARGPAAARPTRSQQPGGAQRERRWAFCQWLPLATTLTVHHAPNATRPLARTLPESARTLRPLSMGDMEIQGTSGAGLHKP